MRTPLLSPVPAVRFAGRYRGANGVDFHQHPGVEVILVTHGQCSVELRPARGPTQHLAATAGEAFVIPADTAHNQLDVGEVRTTYATFTLPPRRFSAQARVIPLALGTPAAGWIEELADFQRSELPTDVRDGLGLALLAVLDHHEHRAQAQGAWHPGLAKALQRIDDDLLEELTVADLARSAGLSTSHLTALFRTSVGCGPLAWQQQQRLALACRLLGNAYLTVAEVGASCGYPDANYFARLFRQRHGCSPSAWRAAHS
jgi:AraC-like DNA-binding protein/mannose-6-phosphate isomerase-like protein (cupin superfamily)